jgi:hypothetical protein
MNRAGLLHDARFAWRSLARSPGVAALAALVLGLGIGASTAVFSVVNSILLKPVPFAEPDRLVMLMLTADGRPFFPGSSPARRALGASSRPRAFAASSSATACAGSALV